MKNDYQEKYVELYKSVYEEELENTGCPEAAYAKGINRAMWAKAVVEGSCEELDKEGIGDWYVSVRYSVILEDIKGWNEDNTNRLKLLHSIGFDINMPWRIGEGMHPRVGMAPKEGEWIEGSERLDPEWIGSGRATMEAIIFSVKDPEHREDLKHLNRSS